MNDYMKMCELKDGYLYRIVARRAKVGIWISERTSFVISRVKFGHNYLFEELHWDSNEFHGTAKPLYCIQKSPVEPEVFLKKHSHLWREFESEELLRYLNVWEKKFETRWHGYMPGVISGITETDLLRCPNNIVRERCI